MNRPPSHAVLAPFATRVLVAMVVGALSTAPGDAWACAACACGDPTINAMGTETPMPGRVRLSLVGGWRAESTPHDIATVPRRADELRFELTAAGALGDRVWLSGTLPVLRRGLARVDGSRSAGFGWGDAELRARITAWRAEGPTPAHQLGVSAGLVLPTALRLRADGAIAEEDLQPGTGSITPMVGVWHAWRKGWVSGFTSVSGRLSFLGYDQRTPGPVGLLSTQVQVQPIPEVAPRLQVDARLSATTRLDGEPEGIGGGWLVAVTPGLLTAPSRAVALFVDLRIPVAQRLEQGARESIQPIAGVAVDL